MGSSSSKQTNKGALTEKEALKKQESSTITSSDRVKLQLKVQRDNLVASIRKYERVADSEHDKAKEFMKEGNKRRALYCLKRERMQKEQVQTVTGILDNVQHLLDTIEFAQIETEVVSALSDGKTELQRLNKMLNIDDLEKLMDETAESIELAQQIDAVLSQPLTSGVDNDVLLAELKVQIGLDETPEGVAHVKVPSHKLPTPETLAKEPASAKPVRTLEAA